MTDVKPGVLHEVQFICLLWKWVDFVLL